MIFYLMEKSGWETATRDPFEVPGAEGFVHCCDERQVTEVRQRLFQGEEHVVAIGIDPTRLKGETRYEQGSGGEQERYPHVYGSLERSAVASVRDV